MCKKSGPIITQHKINLREAAHTSAVPMLARRLTSCFRAAGPRCVPCKRTNQGRLHVSCEASTTRPIYQGAYGTFQILEEDEREVALYRAGINVAAAASVVTSLTPLLPSEAREAVMPALDAVALAGMAGLGLSLTQIHIYVDPLKKALQVLWAVGVLGSLFIMATQDDPAAVYVAGHPIAVWLVGPFFASLTGVAFKEGLCYGKWEAAGLFGTTPLLLLGHLSGLVSEDGERGLLVAFNVLLLVFALRKWTQPVKDDVGDKSVFEYLQLPPEEQALRVRVRRSDDE